MSSAEDNDGDVWAEAVAEQEQAGRAEATGPAEPTATAATAAADASDGPVEHAPVAEPEAVGETGPAEGNGSGPELPFGPELAPLVDEVRRFASSVGEKVTALGSGATDPMEVLQNLAAPLRSKSPAVYGHLLAAGGELIAAYRAAVSASERRWAEPKKNGTEHIDLD